MVTNPSVAEGPWLGVVARRPSTVGVDACGEEQVFVRLGCAASLNGGQWEGGWSKQRRRQPEWQGVKRVLVVALDGWRQGKGKFASPNLIGVEEEDCWYICRGTL